MDPARLGPEMRPSPSAPPTTTPTRASAGPQPDARSTPSRPELAVAWALLAAAVLSMAGPSRLQAALQIATLGWAARLTLHRSPRASLHAAVVIAGVIGIDVVAALIPGLAGR